MTREDDLDQLEAAMSQQDDQVTGFEVRLTVTEDMYRDLSRNRDDLAYRLGAAALRAIDTEVDFVQATATVEQYSSEQERSHGFVGRSRWIDPECPTDD